ncbi:unnamed protein product [Rhizophagus irregularis]|uniref:HTH CENPB-type domain-containing protein n=1 Tax=Rhizophagus irregularis TaxID=588596 RepID=A0A916EAY9_9GLOM|nr:unnamed protein product [Rhizophagus irregularis]
MVANPNIKQSDVASFFNEKYIGLNIQRTTINKIWKDKQKWLSVLSTSQFSHTFRQRSVQFPEVDKAMQIWTSQAIAAGLPLSDMILQQKGLEFAKMFNMDDKLKCANGWVYRFKKRNGIHKIKLSGEANSAPIESLPEERARLRALLAKYDKEDIYNADETGLFFRIEPNQTLGTSPTSGYKMDKNRISILFCTNATGNHKFRPLVIGKSFNPRCFKNFNKSALPVTYRANSKAWMRSDIFVEWLNHLDYYFRTLNRKILLIIDNAGSHFNPKRFEKNDNDISNDEMSNEENNLNELESLLSELPEDSDGLLEYFQMLDKKIPTEEVLTDEQIINFIQRDENEKDDNNNDDDDDDDDDVIVPLISAKKAVDLLETYIKYFEQQNDDDFDFNDLQIFKKYLRVTRFKAFNSKNQTILDTFLN